MNKNSFLILLITTIVLLGCKNDNKQTQNDVLFKYKDLLNKIANYANTQRDIENVLFFGSRCDNINGIKINNNLDAKIGYGNSLYSDVDINIITKNEDKYCNCDWINKNISPVVICYKKERDDVAHLKGKCRYDIMLRNNLFISFFINKPEIKINSYNFLKRSGVKISSFESEKLIQDDLYNEQLMHKQIIDFVFNAIETQNLIFAISTNRGFLKVERAISSLYITLIRKINAYNFVYKNENENINKYINKLKQIKITDNAKDLQNSLNIIVNTYFDINDLIFEKLKLKKPQEEINFCKNYINTHQFKN